MTKLKTVNYRAALACLMTIFLICVSGTASAVNYDPNYNPLYCSPNTGNTFTIQSGGLFSIDSDCGASAIVTNPSHGTLTYLGVVASEYNSPTWRYDATGGYTGTDTFTVSVSSSTGGGPYGNFGGGGGTEPITFNVQSAPITTTQAIPTTTLSAGQAASFTPVTASGGSGALSYALYDAAGTALATLPAGLTFSTTTGQISGTTTTALAQTTYTVKVTDQTNPTPQSASQTFQLTVTASAANSVAISAGNNQSATVNTAFPTALAVVVKDAYNNVAPGVSVTFTAPGSGASGTFAGSATVVTNASGIATAPAFTANITTGSYSVTATAAGVATPSSFSLTNTPGAASSITISAGNNQSAAINTAFATALAVVVKDVGNNVVSGVSVTFAAPGSGASGTFAGSTTVVTNASGIATAPAFTANATAGSYSVTASIPGGGSVPFSLTNAKTANTITFNPIGSVSQGTGPVALVASATSGDTVVFSSLTPAICTVSGASATLVPGATGTCTIAANDPGNATFVAAAQVTQSFQIALRPDPSKDAEVIGLVTAQTQAAEQFADVQVQNVNGRLEQMHGDGYAPDSFGVSVVNGAQDDSNNAQGFADADPLQQRGKAAMSATDQALVKADRENQQKDKLTSGKEKAAAIDRAFAFWTAGAIQVGRIHNNNTATTTDLTTGGLSAGVDYRLSQFLSIGLGFGYGATTAEIGNNGTKTTGRNYDAILYSSIRPTTTSFIDLLAGAGLLDFTSNRYITGGFGTATGKRTGYELFGSVTAGVDIKRKQYTLTPYVRLDGKTGTLNAFDENAPAPWALHYNKETFSAASVDLGMKAATKLKNELDFVQPFFRAEFQHDIVSNANAGLTYVDLVGTGTTYNVAMAGSDANRVMLGLGADMTVDDFKYTIEYINAFSTSSSSDTSLMRVRISKQF